MTAKYPNDIADTGAYVTDTNPWLPNDRADATSTTTKHKNDHNRLADEVVAIETELGTNPKGVHADVTARLDNVDTLVDGNQFKRFAVVAATSNITVASPGASIDGVSMSADDRVLLTAQSTSSQNGLWVWNGAATPMTRPDDANDSNDTVSGMTVYISEGTSAEAFWVLTTTGTIAVDTDAQTFEKKIMPAGSKGNILSSTGSALAQLAVGTDGQVLKALASEATGLVWADSLQAKIGNFSTAASVGTQSVTGVGFTPKIVLFFSISSDLTTTASMFLGGMTTTDQFNVSTLADGTPDYHRISTSDRCFSTLSATGSYNRRAEYSSMDADGFTINWTTASSGATVYYVALA